MPSKGIMQFRPISDALRCILSSTGSGPNLAATKDAFGPRHIPLSVSLLRDGFTPRKERCTLASWDGLRLRALASARMCAGPRAWEVERLYLPGKDGMHDESTGGASQSRETLASGPSSQEDKNEVAELLEALTVYATSMGAERVFLRVQSVSPVTYLAQRAGFLASSSEILLEGSGRGWGQRRADSLVLRPKLPHEDYAIFQLYSAATPNSIRSSVGMTFDQWKDSGDGGGGGIREEVYEREGRIVAWLGSSLGSRPPRVELMVHPDAVEALPALLDYALEGRGVQSWLVPEYQEFLGRLLIHRGFREVAELSLLVKTTAVRAKSPSLSPAEVRVW